LSHSVTICHYTRDFVSGTDWTLDLLIHTTVTSSRTLETFLYSLLKHWMGDLLTPSRLQYKIKKSLCFWSSNLRTRKNSQLLQSQNLENVNAMEWMFPFYSPWEWWLVNENYREAYEWMHKFRMLGILIFYFPWWQLKCFFIKKKCYQETDSILLSNLKSPTIKGKIALSISKA